MGVRQGSISCNFTLDLRHTGTVLSSCRSFQKPSVGYRSQLHVYKNESLYTVEDLKA